MPRNRLRAVAAASNSSRFSSFFPRVCLIFPNLVKLYEISRHHFHRLSYLYRTGGFQVCRLHNFWIIEQRSIDPEKILKVSILLIFWKTQFGWRWKVRSTSDIPIWPACHALFNFEFLMTHLSNFLSYGRKMDTSNKLLRFISANCFSGEVIFFNSL